VADHAFKPRPLTDVNLVSEFGGVEDEAAFKAEGVSQHDFDGDLRCRQSGGIQSSPTPRRVHLGFQRSRWHRAGQFDRLPACGQGLVAVPSGGPECTFMAPTGTLALSTLSLGQAVGIKKSGNTVDQVDQTITSTVSCVGVIYSGPYDTSTVTKVEIAWQAGQGVWFSGSSNTFAS
jgi:hypothetical protein